MARWTLLIQTTAIAALMKANKFITNGQLICSGNRTLLPLEAPYSTGDTGWHRVNIRIDVKWRKIRNSWWDTTAPNDLKIDSLREMSVSEVLLIARCHSETVFSTKYQCRHWTQYTGLHGGGQSNMWRLCNKHRLMAQPIEHTRTAIQTSMYIHPSSQ